MHNTIKVILWDFDGVILDSNHVRESGFREVLKNFPTEQVDQLIDYHQKNGGLSRYVKFKFFFESIRKESITEEGLALLAEKFSEIMKKSLVDKQNLISQTVDFIKNNIYKYKMHIVSGSDQEELRYLCAALGIADFFISIHGSPTSKNDLVASLLNKYKNIDLNDVLLIGDSINDFEAAKINKINFLAYNNNSINHLSNIDFEFS